MAREVRVVGTDDTAVDVQGAAFTEACYTDDDWLYALNAGGVS